MRITDVRTIPLSGATHDTGWPGGTRADEQMNTLVEVRRNTGIGVAADLALSAALPVARWVEYPTGVPCIEDIIDPPFRLEDEGMLRVLTGPGLGVRLNRDALGRYTR